ncbi:unnamed protein product [Peronospora destructor]|uniref:Uncharacterized protein n=1 Tax=Peronospora destructor TaxID=86335 RepID=A0AAV0UP30_9STRA|nr:unnamed protein product [Peronospora destructor]
MRLSGFFQNVWDLVRRSFEDCTSCCDMLDPDYYRKTSPGVYTTPQMFNHWDHDVKHDFTQSRYQSSLSLSTSSQVDLTQNSTSSGSRLCADSSSNNPYYNKERNRRVQFLFYSGSVRPSSTGGLYSSGYRSDMISNDALSMQPTSPAAIKLPRINHDMPCFFSPRDTLQSPMSAPIYSPHIFKITEQQTRRSTGCYSMQFGR